MRVLRARIDRARCGTRPGLVLSLFGADGRVGRGEATPWPGLSPETIDDAHDALASFAAHLPAEIPADPGGVATVVDDLPSRAPSARFAAETALLELVARGEDVSLATLLRGGPAPHLVRCAAVVHAPDPQGAVAEATLLVSRGVRALKRKVRGRSFEAELEVLTALRHAIGDAIELRVDANGAWSLEEARARLAILSRVGVSLVEEPVAGAALCALGPVATPWAADESLRDATLPPRLLAQPSCRALVLKPMLLGGLRRCLALAELADEAGKDVIVTHMFDGPVALAACEALAAALPRPPLACGLDARHLDRPESLTTSRPLEAHT